MDRTGQVFIDSLPVLPFWWYGDIYCLCFRSILAIVLHKYNFSYEDNVSDKSHIFIIITGIIPVTAVMPRQTSVETEAEISIKNLRS